MNSVKILGTGCYIPPHTITNEDFTKIIETSDEWIKTRTGISERHVCDGEPTWYMAVEAGKSALEASGVSAADIGLIIVSTVCNDFVTPSVACMVQRELGAENAMTIDVNCACSGFVYAFDMARRYLATEPEIKHALVIGAEMLSRITDYTDRASCILFGDGAGSVLLSPADGVYCSHLGADGTGAKFLCARSFTVDHPFVENRVHIDDGLPECKGHALYQDGKEVYKFATKALPTAALKAAEKGGIDINSIDLFIPHQANVRIIQTAAQHLGVSEDKFYLTIHKYGNTSSSSIPIALDDAVKSGRLMHGMRVCLVGFGAGLTYGAVIIDY